jgi:hypothetical protein
MKNSKNKSTNDLKRIEINSYFHLKNLGIIYQ